MLVNTKKSQYAKNYAGDYNNVRWTGGFWKDAVDTCAGSMVPHLQQKFEAKDISHVVENFRICAGDAEGEFDGTVFGDGDFYKWMESELYAATFNEDAFRLSRLDYYIDLIARSQQPDGYISTKQIIEQRSGCAESRLKDINEFEVYNMGHLFTSACLHYRITGKDNFLSIAKHAADYLQSMYDDAEKNGDVQTAVCPSHYMGLIEMYRTTGEEKYLFLAKKAIELRDMVKNGMDDNQDRIPLKQHEKMIGHAVRATYLYSGVTDLYAELGDKEYLSMLHKVWDNMVHSKIYITGGIGALYNGTSPYGNFFVDQKVHQAFGYEYQLPNVTAYNETCASIGLVMWAYRMFLVEPSAKYFDMIERVMLNTNLAAVSLDGKKYFYENMLRRAKKLEYELIWPLTRSEYILSYCCPPNLARMIMQSGEYAYTQSKDTIWLGMYGMNEAHFKLDNGAEFVLEQKTQYPYDGKIVFTIKNVIQDAPTSIMLRIPGWTESGSICYQREKYTLTRQDSESYAEIRLESLIDAEITLELETKARFTIAHPMVEEDCLQAAVEYGPLVYCMESVDVSTETLDNIYLNPMEDFTSEIRSICDRKVMVITGKAYELVREDYDRNALYQPLRKVDKKPIDITLIPYFAWDNREFGEMRIWFPYEV